MTEYVNVRASEILDQGELVEFLRVRFPDATKPIGRMQWEGSRTVEARVPAHSPEFQEISDFIVTRRQQEVHGFSAFSIGWYLRKYTKQDLRNAEALQVTITPHFEPAGEECGSIYETLCDHCNLGRQVSDLSLDLRRVPQHKDVSETIARVEWVVSSRFVQCFRENALTGAAFLPVFDLRKPLKPSANWHQLRISGIAGELAQQTRLGRDPFSPSQIQWKCPLGHSTHAALLSEMYLQRNTWEGSDIAVTSARFGQGRNLLRPSPFIIISQRMYRALEAARIRGVSYDRVHLV